MRTKRKKLEQTTKSSKVEHINVGFTILESPLVEEGEKELKLRIIGTNQEVLGSDNDRLQNSDELFSMTKDFVYNGSEEDFKFKYEQEASYKAGTYFVELWEGDHMIIRTAFNLD